MLAICLINTVTTLIRLTNSKRDRFKCMLIVILCDHKLIIVYTSSNLKKFLGLNECLIIG